MGSERVLEGVEKDRRAVPVYESLKKTEKKAGAHRPDPKLFSDVYRKSVPLLSFLDV